MKRKNTVEAVLIEYEQRRNQLIKNIENWESGEGRFSEKYYRAKRKLEALNIEINNFLVMNGIPNKETTKEEEERKAWAKTGKTVWQRPEGVGRPTLGTAWDNNSQGYKPPEWTKEW